MRKYLTSVVLVLLSLTLVFGLVGCNKNKGDPNETTETKPPIDAGVDEFDPGLPDKTFEDGTVFTFAVRWKGGEDSYIWNNSDIIPVDVNANQLNAASYERNMYIEEKYNITIEIFKAGNSDSNMYGSEMADSIYTNALTGDIAIDAILSTPVTTIGFAMRNLLVDLERVEYLNFEQQWWNSAAVEDLRMGDKVYMVAGDVTLVDDKATCLFAYNKDLFESLELPDIYDTVNNKQWTLAKLSEYSTMAYVDTNGMGDVDIGDTFGFTYWQDQAYPFLNGCGLNFAKMNADGIPEMQLSDEKFVTAWSKIIDILDGVGVYDRTAYSASAGWTAEAESQTAAIFNSGRALFTGLSVANLINVKNADTGLNYGVIPNPMYDEEQDDYVSSMSPYAYSMLSIPTQTDDDRLSDIGYILEAFSAASCELVRPVFYETVLAYRVAEAPEDAEMLDLIFDSVRYDIGLLLNFGDFCSSILKHFNEKDKNISSWYASNRTSIDTAIEEMRKLFE